MCSGLSSERWVGAVTRGRCAARAGEEGTRSLREAAGLEVLEDAAQTGALGLGRAFPATHNTNTTGPVPLGASCVLMQT